MKKIKEKSPYGDFTIEEILAAEKDAYLIQLGGEFFDYNKNYSFTKETAEKYYYELFTGLREMLNDDKKRDKAEILSSLMNLRIIPLRFH